jgi:hypothetical protein
MTPIALASAAALLASAVTAQVPASPRAAAVKSIAVMPLKAKGTAQAQQDLADVLGDVLLYAVQAQAKDCRVVGKSDIDAMLGLEKMKDAVGCDQTSCAAELAGALGVDSIITGSIGNLGGKYILSLTWISQRDGLALGRFTQNIGSDESTFDKSTYAAVQRLFGGAPEASTPAPAPTAAPVPPADGKLGVRVADVSAGLQQQLGLAPGRYAAVRRVVVDSIAARAGVQAGDILLAVNGQDVASARSFAEDTRALPSGAVVQLKVLRPATSETLTLALRKP